MRLHEIRSFIADRLNAETFLGLHLTLCLIVASGALWAFGETLDAVTDSATMVRWDLATAALVHRHVTPRGLRLFDTVSHAGSPTTMIAISIIAGVVLLIQRRPTLLTTWIAVMVGGGIIEHLLKYLVGRHRPPYGAQFLTDQSASFPSGHAMMSTLALGMLVYVLIVTGAIRSWTRVAVIVAAVVVDGVICLSRVYLGVHYPSDVLGGFLAAGAWLAICIGVAGVVLHRRGYSLAS